MTPKVLLFIRPQHWTSRWEAVSPRFEDPSTAKVRLARRLGLSRVRNLHFEVSYRGEAPYRASVRPAAIMQGGELYVQPESGINDSKGRGYDIMALTTFSRTTTF
jgi:hypothetical protein